MKNKIDIKQIIREAVSWECTTGKGCGEASRASSYTAIRILCEKLGFEHYTLDCSPLENILKFIEGLKNETTKH